MKQTPDNSVLPEQLASINAYVQSVREKIADTVIGYIANGVKLVDFKDDFATVRKYFRSLPKDATLDDCISWSRWQEHWFGADTKLKKDYINRLARPKREQSSLPKKTKTKTDSDALTAAQVSREISANDFSVEELEHLQETIAAELKRKRSADSETEPVAHVVAKQTVKPKRATKKEPKRSKTVRMLPQSSQHTATTDDNPFDYEEEHVDAVIDRLNGGAKPNLDQLDGAGD